MLFRAAVLAACLALAWSDTPANCLYEDIRGTWTFQETERSGDSSLSCDALGPVVHTKTFTLSFPDTATDELGNEGTWTMVWNQGFEVNINERSYFAFSYYEGDFTSSTSYCDRTFNGWSRDKTIRNWSCFSAQKNTKVAPRTSRKVTQPLSKLHKAYKNDEKLVSDINASQTSWRAKAYPEHEKFSRYQMFLRAGGPGAVVSNPPSPAPATPQQKARVSFLPENFDWRDVEGVNYVSDVRDQGGCGSCYTFASMGQIETRLRIATRSQRQDVFSTQVTERFCGAGSGVLRGSWAVEGAADKFS